MIKNILFGRISTTVKLILLNIGFFILYLILASFIPNLFDYISLKPSLIVQGKYLWTLVTSMFMHGSFMHLFVNMISLWFIGGFLERIIGKKRFVYFYLISGIIAGIIFSLLAGFFGFGILERVFGSPDIPGVGASGALFGLIGLLAVIVPRNKVYLIVGPLIAIIAQAVVGLFIKNTAVLTLIGLIVSVYIFLAIFSMFSFNYKTRKISLPIEMPLWFLPVAAIVPLVVIGLFVPLPIGNMAHLGGLVVGLVYGYYLRRKYKKKIRMLNRMFR